MRAYNFAGSRRNRPELILRDVAGGRGDNEITIILQGCPYKIWDGKKCQKFGAIFWQLSTMIANISEMDWRNEYLNSI